MTWPEICTWIDDDKGTLDLKFQGEKGGTMFDYTVQLKTPNVQDHLPTDSEVVADLIVQQVPLGREFSEVLHKNLWDLYEGGTSDVE